MSRCFVLFFCSFFFYNWEGIIRILEVPSFWTTWPFKVKTLGTFETSGIVPSTIQPHMEKIRISCYNVLLFNDVAPFNTQSNVPVISSRLFCRTSSNCFFSLQRNIKFHASILHNYIKKKRIARNRMRNGETNDGEISFAGAPYLQNQRRPHHFSFEGDITAGAYMSCEPHAVWGAWLPFCMCPILDGNSNKKKKVEEDIWDLVIRLYLLLGARSLLYALAIYRHNWRMQFVVRRKREHQYVETCNITHIHICERRVNINIHLYTF